jgi:hypothetical protein
MRNWAIRREPAQGRAPLAARPAGAAGSRAGECLTRRALNSPACPGDGKGLLHAALRQLMANRLRWPVANRHRYVALPVAGEQGSDLLDGKINFQIQVDLAKFC